MILGQTPGERFRTIATIIVLALIGLYLGVCVVAEKGQEAGYRSAQTRFASLSMGYSKQHGFELQDGGGRRNPYWRDSQYNMYLVKGNEELYIVHGIARCRWFGADLHRVTIEFPPFGKGDGVDITEEYLARQARPPRVCLEGVAGFPSAEEFRREIEYHNDPDLDMERMLEQVKRRAPVASMEDPSKHGPAVSALASLTGINGTFELSEVAVRLAGILAVVLLLVLSMFGLRFLRRDPPLPWSRRLFFFGWGAAVLAILVCLCSKLHDLANFQPLPESGGMEMRALGRILLVVGFAFYLWLIYGAGKSFAQIPPEGPPPTGGWRHFRLGAAGAVVLSAGYFLLGVGMVLNDPSGIHRHGETMILVTWGGMLLALIGGVLLIVSVVSGLRDLCRPIGQDEPPLARFIVVAIPLLFTLPGFVCLMILAEVR